MFPCPAPPFVELVDCRGADDGQREQGFGALSGIDAVLWRGGGHLRRAAVRHRIGRRRGAERIAEEIGPLATHVDDVVCVLGEFLAEILDPAPPAFFRARYQVADPPRWFAGQAFDPEAISGAVGDLYLFVLERDRFRLGVGPSLVLG
jgi:hypothetical protein